MFKFKIPFVKYQGKWVSIGVKRGPTFFYPLLVTELNFALIPKKNLFLGDAGKQIRTRITPKASRV